ncbi:MAG: beta-ketoacyl-ACP synthase III [Alphaproteobacteria bacterium]|jgi:3-oxoacyl-[acyl-carrier-protein] synthase-3
MNKAVIKGVGGFLPKREVTNQDLSKFVATSHDWIVERTGILKRHIADENTHVSDMAYEASLIAIKNAKIKADDIDLIIIATTSPDNTFPSSASKLQNLLGVKRPIPAFDVQAVCTGFIYILSIAESFIKSGKYKTILLVGADKLSALLDWTDRTTCILFGDGAGAVILQAEENTSSGVIATNIFSEGKYRDLLLVDGGVGQEKKVGVLKMQGKEVFKHAVEKMSNATLELLKENNLKVADIDYLVPHQANIRIMQAVAERLGIPTNKIISTVANHANTSAASIPLALSESFSKFKKGDLIAMQAIGGGLTWGAALVRV